MNKAPKGMYVPIITPFREDQSIDFEAFKKVIDYVIEGGVDGLLITGSTGEYHTMTLEEQKEVIKVGCEYVAGRKPIIAGVGKSTAKATIELANFAADCGAEYGLVLPPYYQPTTRAYIDQIRGVDSSYTVGLLLERRMIEECGTLQVPGRPRLYRTTKEFLRAFHLNTLEDLPEMPGLENDGQLRLENDGTISDDTGNEMNT